MNWWTVCGDIANVIATGLAALSIVITIKEQRTARENEKNKAIAEQDLNWYNELALNDIIVNLNSFIDESERALYMCKGFGGRDSLENELKEAYDGINGEFKSLRVKISILKIFSNHLSFHCTDCLQKIFDIYSEIINGALDKGYLLNVRDREVQDERNKIIEELYRYKSNFVNDK